MSVTIHTGDCTKILRDLPADSVHCVVTSPPYWGLRDYGVEGQLGLERDYREYIERLVEVFREVRRVLRADGTVWLNLGDSYARPSGKGEKFRNGKGHRWSGQNPSGMTGPDVPSDLKEKDLMMMPARVALALQEDGWWLRSEIVWAKSNPMPESVTDRPTSAHEKVYLLAKSKAYYFDAEAVREAEAWPLGPNAPDKIKSPYGQGFSRKSNHMQGTPRNDGDRWRTVDGGVASRGNGRNIRNVWTIATAPFSEAHFATFPPALIEPCIKAGTSEKGCCVGCGTPWVRDVERTTMEIQRSERTHSMGHTRSSGTMTKPPTSKTLGWSPSCACKPEIDGGSPQSCTVLDPFGGAGTTGLVADRLGRDAILIELNPEYAAMARQRIHADAGMFAKISATEAKTLDSATGKER